MPVVGTRDLELRVAAVDVSAEISAASIDEDEDSDGFPSYERARNGGARKWMLKMTLRQNTAAAALWYYAWGSTGTQLAVEFWPCGRPVSGTASVAQPKFSGTVVVSGPTGTLLGGEAKNSVTAAQVTELSWDFTAKPTLTTT